MKHVKKLILMLTCFMVLISSFIVPSYASELVPDPDMLDEGWIFDNGDYYIPSDFELPSVFLRTQANYPDFDPNDIPWDSAPEAVKNVLFNTPFISTNTQDYVNPWKIPFVLVITNGDVVRVFAGINLVFLTYFATSDDRNNFTPTGSYVGIQVLNASGSVVTGVEYAFCYEAVFDFDTMKITTPWRTAEKASIGNRFTRFSGNILSLDSKYDFYGYGGNNVGPGKIQFSYHTSSNGTGYPAVYAVTDSSIGFAAGASAFVFNNAQYSNAYFAPFTPQTLEQKEHETSKGIFQSLKDLPGKISGFFDNLILNLNTFLTNLKNYLLYFQKTEPTHINPFDNILGDISDFFDEQMSEVTSFKNSLSSILNKVSSYISSGSGVINSVLTAVPILSAFVTFFIVFCVVRKVIGR